MGSVVKSKAINVKVLSCKSSCHPNVKLSVKLRVFSIHASDGLSDLTLRETPTQTRGSCDGAVAVITGVLILFSLNHEDFQLPEITDWIKSWLKTKHFNLPHFLTPVISVRHPSLLPLAFRVSGLDHVAPYLHYWTSVELLLLQFHCFLFIQKHPSEAAHSIQLSLSSFFKTGSAFFFLSSDVVQEVWMLRICATSLKPDPPCLKLWEPVSGTFCDGAVLLLVFSRKE